jgi:hypothetical protein
MPYCRIPARNFGFILVISIAWTAVSTLPALPVASLLTKQGQFETISTAPARA